MSILPKNITAVKFFSTITSLAGISTMVGVVPEIIGASATVIGIIITLVICAKQCKNLNAELNILKRQKTILERMLKRQKDILEKEKG